VPTSKGAEGKGRQERKEKGEGEGKREERGRDPKGWFTPPIFQILKIP